MMVDNLAFMKFHFTRTLLKDLARDSPPLPSPRWYLLISSDLNFILKDFHNYLFPKFLNVIALTVPKHSLSIRSDPFLYIL